MAGVTDTGFVIKTLLEIQADIEDRMKAAFGQNIKLDTKSVYGKLVGVFSQPLADVWELAQVVYNSMYPSTATTTSATDGTAELVGVTRNAGVPSTAEEVLEGQVGTTIPAGSLVATTDTGEQFETDDAITLSAAVAVRANTSLVSVATGTYTITINGTAFDFAATVPTDDADDISAGLEAAINAGAEPVTATDLTGGLVQVDGDDDADGLPTPFTVSVSSNVVLGTVGNLQDISSVEADAIVGAAGSIAEIVNPQSGWTAAWNPLDAILGDPEETDAELRARRAVSLSIPGAGTPEAILAAILDIDDVTAAIVIENTGDVTDANGLPPHSMECVIENGDEDDIGDVLWERKPGGIALHGDESVVVVDSQGYGHVLGYSRPTNVLQWMRATYTTYDEEEFPSNGEATMAATLLAEGNALSLGHDLLPDRFSGPVFDAVAGIETLLIEIADDVTGSPGTYSTTPKDIEFNEIAKLDSGRITIVAA